MGKVLPFGLFLISKYIGEVVDDDNFSKKDFELHSRLHE